MRAVTRRNASIGIAAAVIFAFSAYYMMAGPVEVKPQLASHTPQDKSLSRLYDEARRDLKNKKYKAAASKFRQIANIKPGFKDTEAREESALRALAEQARENGDTSAAPGATAPGDDNPGESASRPDESSPAVDNPADNGTSTTGGEVNAPMKSIPDGATALSLHMDEIDGYISTRKAWDREPIQARSVYMPIADGIRDEIEAVIVTISKYDADDKAKEHLQRTKDQFPVQREDVKINSHGAYTGVSLETHEFARLKESATLSWTRGYWYFAVDVFPTYGGTPSNPYKKGIARDIALKLGY